MFYGCKNLKSVEFSEGLEKIGLFAFAGSGIERVVLPHSTKVIGGSAFRECEYLYEVRLNEGLEALGVEESAYQETEKGRVF